MDLVRQRDMSQSYVRSSHALQQHQALTMESETSFGHLQCLWTCFKVSMNSYEKTSRMNAFFIHPLITRTLSQALPTFYPEAANRYGHSSSTTPRPQGRRKANSLSLSCSAGAGNTKVDGAYISDQEEDGNPELRKREVWEADQVPPLWTHRGLTTDKLRKCLPAERNGTGPEETLAAQ